MEYRVGDDIWFVEKWSGTIVHGKISSIIDNNMPSARYEVEGVTLTGTFTLFWWQLFHTEEGCIDYEQAKSQSLISKYKNEINSVEDLVRFMFNNPVSNCEEYIDYDARCAVIQRAKEMLNINLEEH